MGDNEVKRLISTYIINVRINNKQGRCDSGKHRQIMLALILLILQTGITE